MSNLSDIGFPVTANEDLNKLIETWLLDVSQITARKGAYLKFSDRSGAEIFLQMDEGGDLTGLNPYFNGLSSRNVLITELIERDSSPLDGGFHAFSNADSEGGGDYPFVFDVPDIFRSKIDLPSLCRIQLNAFATNDLVIYPDEQAYRSSQTDEVKFAPNSFVPIGLFRQKDGIPPQAHARFAGTVREFEVKKNHASGAAFYWMLVETMGGEIDVVADPNYVKIEPGIGSIIHGSFWLTGRILNS